MEEAPSDEPTQGILDMRKEAWSTCRGSCMIPQPTEHCLDMSPNPSVPNIMPAMISCKPTTQPPIPSHTPSTPPTHTPTMQPHIFHDMPTADLHWYVPQCHAHANLPLHVLGSPQPHPTPCTMSMCTSHILDGPLQATLVAQHCLYTYPCADGTHWPHSMALSSCSLCTTVTALVPSQPCTVGLSAICQVLVPRQPWCLQALMPLGPAIFP